MKHSFFHQRNKQWTCLAHHRNFRINAVDILCIQLTFYCPFCTNNSNTFVLCTFNCRLCSRFYNTDDWNVYFFLYCIKGKSTCRVTRNHNCLYVLCFQKSNNLSGVTYNRILRLATIWNSSRITKICNALFRKLSYYLTCHC